MGKQKSFQQVLQTFVEKLKKLNKTAKFPCTFSSNLYTKSCICYCDFTLEQFLYVLSLIRPQIFLPHSKNWCISVHSLDKKNAACFVSPHLLRFTHTWHLHSLSQNQKRCSDLLVSKKSWPTYTWPLVQLFPSGYFQEGDHKECRKSVTVFRKEGNGEFTLTNSTKASPP